ncbi:MAG: MerR family transcriptional regulator [Acidobacteriota bacterium]
MLASQPPARFPMRVVVRRTGLNAALIRTWERRYGAVCPVRTPGGHRVFSEREVERLRMLRQAILEGRTIGQVAHLDDERLRRLLRTMPTSSGRARPTTAAATAPPPTPLPHAEIEPALAAARRLDASGLRARIDRSVQEIGLVDTLERLVAPLLARAGLHDESSLLDRFVRLEIGLFAAAELRAFTASRPLALAASFGDPLHALLSGLVAATAGWGVACLDRPHVETLDAAAHLCAPDALLLAVEHGDVARTRQAIALLPPNVPLVIGGPAARSLDGTTRWIAPDLEDLRQIFEWLNEPVDSPRRR